MSEGFPNKAGDHGDTDDILRAELKAAGIPTIQEADGKPPEYMQELLRSNSGEVKTSVLGVLFGWKFERAWYYWMCSGPGIDVETAERLHERHGKEVRVAGHCGCPSPTEWYKGLAVGKYHVDTPEGLKALADTIKMLADRVKTPEQYRIRLNSALEDVKHADKLKWNERFLEELQRRDLYISSTPDKSEKYPDGFPYRAPTALTDGENAWPEYSYIVWKLDT